MLERFGIDLVCVMVFGRFNSVIGFNLLLDLLLYCIYVDVSNLVKILLVVLLINMQYDRLLA